MAVVEVSNVIYGLLSFVILLETKTTNGRDFLFLAHVFTPLRTNEGGVSGSVSAQECRENWEYFPAGNSACLFDPQFS